MAETTQTMLSIPPVLSRCGSREENNSTCEKKQLFAMSRTRLRRGLPTSPELQVYAGAMSKATVSRHLVYLFLIFCQPQATAPVNRLAIRRVPACCVALHRMTAPGMHKAMLRFNGSSARNYSAEVRWQARHRATSVLR